MLNVAAVIAAYLVGSVSFPYWIAHRAGVDLRHAGSRKLGGSNLYRTVGPVAGVTGGALDAAKGFGAVLLAGALGLPREVQLACGVAAVAGQMWPAFHSFDGGRANATGWGFALGADPAAALAMSAPLLAGLGLRQLVRPRPSRVLPLAALASFAVWPTLVLARGGLSADAAAGMAVLALILLRRLTAGLRDDLRMDASLGRVLLNRALFDRSELQERGQVAI
ncbi:hypothetical protein BH18CHL2_BH18CHL2_08770 [soil metagenome]